jgi:hypothetical protein
MIEYTVRATGLTYEENLEGVQALLTAFSKWKPEEGLNVLAFVSKAAGRAGYVLVEANDPKVVMGFVTKYEAWNDATVVPVVDIADAVPIFQASSEWAQSAAKA